MKETFVRSEFWVASPSGEMLRPVCKWVGGRRLWKPGIENEDGRVLFKMGGINMERTRKRALQSAYHRIKSHGWVVSKDWREVNPLGIEYHNAHIRYGVDELELEREAEAMGATSEEIEELLAEVRNS